MTATVIALGQAREAADAAAPADPMALPAKTIVEMLRHHAETRPDAIAIRQKRYGIWQPTSFADYWRRARHVGLGLRALGLGPKGHLGILSENRIEWVLAQLGAGIVGAVTVGVYPTSPSGEVAYVLDHADATLVVCEDQEQIDKIIEARADLPKITKVIALEHRGLAGYEPGLVMTFDEVEALGRAEDEKNPGLVDELMSGHAMSDIALLIYTSGSTGRPKGAMLSYRNIRAGATSFLDRYPIGEGWVTLSYLPLCHVAEQATTIFGPLYAASQVNFGESLRTVQEDLREVAPASFLGVPRIWEKMHSGIQVKMAEARPLQRWLYAKALSLCGGFAAKAPDQWSLSERIRYGLAYVAVFRALKNAIGLTRCRIAFTGAAPISPEVIRFFRTIGVPLVEIYGMTETSGGVLGQRADDVVVGTVGAPMKSATVELAPDGEILVRGPQVFEGYYKNPDATAAAVVDGWLHTGDVAERVGSHIKIVDRKKDIMITAGGKNLSPTEIEHAVKTSPYIKECIVFGDRRKYVAALIQIEIDTVGKWAETKGIAFTNYRNLAQHPQVQALIAADVDRANDTLAQVARIRRFEILDKELDHDDGEVTATMKVRRKAIETKYAEAIRRLYAGG
ncbi:AMP-dependent synthetase/ligase [Phreatobacter sp. AB_2022a]|uniref:AMP-dependent synthetase/ligase n=1 Tax=Phreatobacter sp. AB_2022a TaxID=3003134 RepID=UPI002287681B|nr:AMP-binding protein [Phreatobacter sp. AB_2022a]MCZ0735038.1 AMP-binding protein [Phreatobacter sp. AB_2022a]